MAKPKKTAKHLFWEEHIRSWKKGNLSQAQYCAKYKLSKSAFSKWKTKLHPEIVHEIWAELKGTNLESYLYK